MLIYEIQGERHNSGPEHEVKRRLLKKYPPDAEVIIWDGDKEVARIKLNELFNYEDTGN